VWEQFKPGDIFVVLYERDASTEGIPWASRFVSWDGDRLTLYHRPPVGIVGTAAISLGIYEVGRFDARKIDWPYEHSITLVRPGDAHVVQLKWDSAWTFLGWCVSLQTPLAPRSFGYETTEWLLDFTVNVDGSYRWEGDMPHTDALLVLTDKQIRAARTEAARVIAARPWPTGLEDWRPPRDWQPAEVPDGWRDRWE
jgi:hypothetical protein